MDMENYLRQCIDETITRKGQDLFLKVGSKPRIRAGGEVTELDLAQVTGPVMDMFMSKYLNPIQKKKLESQRSVDFAFALEGHSAQRFRGNAFYQLNHISVVIRLLWIKMPSFEELKLPGVLKDLALRRSGIILIGGTVSSGKTTTLHAMINVINEQSKKHIITIEDPVEYLHEDKQSFINQREIGQDAPDFASALKYVVRQSPDVVVIGEMRDAESFEFALSSAEIGRLVIATIHAKSAAQILDRILGFFPADQRDFVLSHLCPNINCFVVEKLLLPKEGVGLVPAFEILIGNYTTQQLIKEKRFDKLSQAMRNAVREGMQTLDQSLLWLWEKGMISGETALESSERPQELENEMKGIKIDGQSGKILGG